MKTIKRKTLKKYRRVLALYVRYAQSGHWDFSDQAAEKMFRCEALGEYKLDALLDEKNGFAIGKHWKDLTVEMWREDIAKAHLTKAELLSDRSICCDMRPTILSLEDHPSYENP